MKHISKKPLIFSIIAMMLCVSLLVGGTIAYFTDTGIGATSRVQAGSLNVQLLKYDGTEYKDVTNGTGDIFSGKNGINWEPGKTEVVFLGVKNPGELAVMFTLIMDATFGEASMNNALEYALIPAMTKDNYDALKISNWEKFKEAENVIRGDAVKGQSFVTSEYTLLPDETEYFVLAVHMKENADNSYQGGAASIDIKVAATQAPYETGSNGSDYDAEPYPELEWESMIGIINFESNELKPMEAYAGDPHVIYNDSRYESKFVLRMNPGDRARFSQNSLPQAAGGNFKITGWFKRDNLEIVPTITYWHRIAENTNEAVTVEISEEYILILNPEGWSYFEIPVEQAANANLAQFIVNHPSKDENAGYIYFDDFRYMRALDENAYLVKDWEEKLAEEQLDSMMVSNAIDDPYAEMEPLSENLLKNGDFSAETGVLLMDKEVKANPTGWYVIDQKTYDTYSEITEEGTFYGKVPVGYNDPLVYNRPVPQLHQVVEDVVPGGVYQIKFRYRINESNNPLASWYGPYIYFSSYGPRLPGIEDDQTIDYAIVRADKAISGLVTNGEWTWFTQTVAVSGQADRIGFDLCMWLYNTDDWCEVDDVQLYLVGYGDQMELDVESKFFYSDMDTTTFTADLKEDTFPETAKDKDANVTFEVYDGKTLVWNTEPIKLSGEGYTAKADFDLSTFTKKGAPYVVKATLCGGDGTKIFETSEQVYLYDRPAALGADGNYAKKMPNGEKLDFNMAYAIIQDHYEKVQEIGCNVMSLSNSQNAEQVLERLDYCLKYGYMGFLNMNWGLYNENDISLKRWVMIDVISDERVRNHPALLGYCLTDEPWSWGSEADVAANLEEGYRLIREYDKDNIIFSVDNMIQFHEKSVKLCDAMFVDHYDPPKGGTIYNKTLKAVEAADGKKPVWVAVGVWRNRTHYPTGNEVRNEIWQTFLAGADGFGYYAITYSDTNEDGPIPIWEVKDLKTGEAIGQETWDGLASFKEKEWDIAYDRFSDGEGQFFSQKIAIEDGYMYSSWVDKNGEMYMVVLNVAGADSVDVKIPLTSDNGKVSIGKFSATVINGSDQADFTGSSTFNVTLQGNEAVLYKITPNEKVDFSGLG